MSSHDPSRIHVRDTTTDDARTEWARAFTTLDLAALGWPRAIRHLPAELLADHPDARPGRVVRVDRGGLLLVATGNTAPIRVRDRTGAASPAVVGDWVLVEAQLDPTGGATTGGYPFARGRVPRAGVLARRDGARSTSPQALAAHVDLVLVVEALSGRRGANAGRIARLAALAAADGIEVRVVLTHADEAEGPHVEGALRTSIVDGRGLDELAELLAGGATATLVGASGAGKSSLANALAGRDVRATGARRASGFGRHTTSTSQLLALPGGGLLVDTPGVRLLGMHADVDAADLLPTDIAALALACRFRDCQHGDGHVGCAVQAAIESGALAPEVVTGWRKLERELLREQARADHRLRRELHQEQHAVTRSVTKARRRGEIVERRR
ncbi:MAG: rsgA [Thermoleophilia bacterium]|nr:rsgA [Thermoleophilia bacterium]